MKKNIVKIIVFVVIALLLYYFLLPPINLTAPEFWSFLFVLGIFYFVINSLSKATNFKLEKMIYKRPLDRSKPTLIILGVIALIAGTILIVNLVQSPLINSKAYYNRINVADSEFITDVKPVDFDKLALLDKDSSSKLGDRVMGEMTDLVSQFYVSDLYTQINYKDQIVRVTPLEYDGIIKYFTNRKNGAEGYITVDSSTGEANLVRLEKGMKYMPSAYFFENLSRKLRLSYPSTIFGEYSFEINEEGQPYWIVETIKYKGIGLRREVSGVIIFDPITGKSEKYNVNEVPTWVDHVYSADLIIEQLNDWGKYKNGFLNSLFGQKNVVKTTDGYNYLAMNDDVYLYTGITSVASDEANVGVVLTNMRTKETKFYNVSGATEISAMASAEGQVQQMKYKSTFPLLVNLNNKPTYLMSLKDNAGLVKMYAFVDYTNYQKVSVTDVSLGIEQAAANYLVGSTSGEMKEGTITINGIQTAVLDGTTYYYLNSNNKVYRASIKVNEKILLFLKVNDQIKVSYSEGEINEIAKIS